MASARWTTLLWLGLLARRGLAPLVPGASLVVLPLLVWGTVRYTRREHPGPAVVAMVLMAVVQALAWGRVAGLV